MGWRRHPLCAELGRSRHDVDRSLHEPRTTAAAGQAPRAARGAGQHAVLLVSVPIDADRPVAQHPRDARHIGDGALPQPGVRRSNRLEPLRGAVEQHALFRRRLDVRGRGVPGGCPRPAALPQALRRAAHQETARVVLAPAQGRRARVSRILPGVGAVASIRGCRVQLGLCAERCGAGPRAPAEGAPCAFDHGVRRREFRGRDGAGVCPRPAMDRLCGPRRGR